ncbi:MAG TPA: bifunctional DNA-formamidopyrimidine glycosylase/DNA-(apurinic or apyrimidinic site) lyase [Paracoccaceae bacterium]|nr:bifunctional DNA-formamidopyrimidine glycosylase/DNA-(apurinic or apyrimidinic site) lyase [Paracoccaceae bacterium]
MPELPEVETVRRGLEPALSGRRLVHVEQWRPDLRWKLPERFAERLTGRRVESLGRRSKWLLLALDDGMSWMVHLGMSGRLLISDPCRGEAGEQQARAGRASGAEGDDCGRAQGRLMPGKHDHLVVTTDLGTTITYNDARRFGAMDLWPTDALSSHPHLARLGPEPLGNAFHADALGAALAGRKSTIKAALLDQRVVAGLGNIYVCEALYRAGIHPARQAGRISQRRIEALAAEIRATLADAIAAGGSTLRDYRHADGDLGYFQHEFRVYGQEGAPCARPSCSGIVQRMTQSGRSTFYCPRCQR